MAVDETHSAERIFAGAIVGIALWIAVNWALALTHALYRWSLVGALVMLAGFAVTRFRGRRITLSTATLIALIPLTLWTLFILWRGSLLPPSNHDVLAYHLPKAALMARAHGFERFAAGDTRITTLPANYELLLADVLLITGNDKLTEWIGTASFLLFLLGTYALARRWWSAGPGAIAAVLATASAPVVLLHSGADKNDILSACFALGALMWGARWVVHGGHAPFVLLLLCLGLGAGTKPNMAAIFVGLAPFVARAIIVRKVAIRDLIIGALCAVVAFLALGGVTYISNITAAGVPVGVAAGSFEKGTSSLTSILYGDWHNLWRFPYMLLARPFSRSLTGLWVPWEHEYWFWPRYEIFFSDYGMLFTFLVLLAPIVAWRYRNNVDPNSRRERQIATIAALIAIVIMLPVVMRPLGFFGAFVRYFAFIIPIVTCATITPFVNQLSARNRRHANLAMAALAVVFVLEASNAILHDRFAPPEYVEYARTHPGTRVIWFYPNRAASVVDRAAKPYDTIAIDGSFETWSYPAFGVKLTRNVVFLPQGATPNDVPAAAQWVIIDRSWNVLWNNPKLQTLGKIWTNIGTGAPTEDDVRLYEMLRRDQRFRLIFRDRRLNQAVFQRVPAR